MLVAQKENGSVCLADLAIAFMSKHHLPHLRIIVTLMTMLSPLAWDTHAFTQSCCKVALHIAGCSIAALFACARPQSW